MSVKKNFCKMDIAKLLWLQEKISLAYTSLQKVANCTTNRSHPVGTSKPTKKRRIDELVKAKNNQPRFRSRVLNLHIDDLITTTPYKVRNKEEFRMRTGMPPHVFNLLLTLVGEQLHANCLSRMISADGQLFLTLVYLSNAEPVENLTTACKVCPALVHSIVQQTCEVLWTKLAPVFMPQPSGVDWDKIVAGYQETWQVPHVLGALDAKLLKVSCVREICVVLLASCDVQLNFTWMNMANVAHTVSTASLWEHEFGVQLLNHCVNLVLPKKPMNLEYGFIVNSDFPLREHLRPPCKGPQLNEDQLNFNRHLDKVLGGSINKAFAILMARWRVLAEPLYPKAFNVEKIVRAAFVLHNFVNLHDSSYRAVPCEEGPCAQEMASQLAAATD